MPPVQRPPPSTIFFRPISCLSLSPSRCCCCLFTLRLVLPPPYVRSFVHTHLSRSLVTTYSLLSPPFLTYLLVNLLTPSHSPHPLLFFSSFLLPRFFFASFRSLHIPGDRPLRGLLSGTRRSGVCDRPQRRTHCQPRCRISLSASLFNSTQLRAPSCPTAPIPYQYPFTGLHCTYMHRQFTVRCQYHPLVANASRSASLSSSLLFLSPTTYLLLPSRSEPTDKVHVRFFYRPTASSRQPKGNNPFTLFEFQLLQLKT